MLHCDEHKKRNTKHIKKIEFILNKSLSFFIIHQISFVIILVSICIQQLKQVCYLFADIDDLLSVMLMYYMIEHNNNEYMKLLKKWRNIKIQTYSCLCSLTNNEEITKINLDIDIIEALTETTNAAVDDDSDEFGDIKTITDTLTTQVNLSRVETNEDGSITAAVNPLDKISLENIEESA